MPGLLAVTPPKRTARGREDETLLFYLTLSGNSHFTPAEYDRIVKQATQRFFQTPGSLTSAIRTAAGDLNQSLLNRNLHTTGKGEYVIGRLILGALHGAQFVFAQCGPTHMFQLNGSETRQVHDEQIAGRGLGIGQSTPLYFAQVDLHNNDLLVLCPNLPGGWESTLLGLKNVSIETLRRSLLGSGGEDLNAVMVQVKAGKGNLNILPGRQAAQAAPAAATVASIKPGRGYSSRRASTGSGCERVANSHTCQAYFTGGKWTSGGTVYQSHGGGSPADSYAHKYPAPKLRYSRNFNRATNPGRSRTTRPPPGGQPDRIRFAPGETYGTFCLCTRDRRDPRNQTAPIPHPSKNLRRAGKGHPGNPQWYTENFHGCAEIFTEPGAQ